MTRTQRIKYNLIIQYTKEYHVNTFLVALYSNQYVELAFHDVYTNIRISDDLMELIATKRTSSGRFVPVTVTELPGIIEEDYAAAIIAGGKDPAGIRTALGELIASRKG